jgi:hypothetical protein
MDQSDPIFKFDMTADPNGRRNASVARVPAVRPTNCAGAVDFEQANREVNRSCAATAGGFVYLSLRNIHAGLLRELAA